MVIKTAQKLARQATRSASGIAAKAVGKVAGGMATRVADQAGKLAGRLKPAGPADDAIKVEVRKVVTFVEEIRHEGGPRPNKPYLRGAIAAVIANPFAGRYVENVARMMDALKPLGYELASELIRALGGPKKIESYGKGGVIGVAGESEHGALWHVPGGYGMRELLDNSRAIVPSTFKVGPAGTSIDIPLHHRTAAYVRSHFDTVTMCVPDAPRPDEIMFVLAMGAGPRIHHRMGGMRASEISTFDGQR